MNTLNIWSTRFSWRVSTCSPFWCICITCVICFEKWILFFALLEKVLYLSDWKIDITSIFCSIYPFLLAMQYVNSLLHYKWQYSTSCYPNLDYPTPWLSEWKHFTSHTHIHKSHVGHGNCEILQNGVFQSSKEHQVPKMYWLSKRNWIYASSWLLIDPMWSSTEVDDQLQLQNLKENVGHAFKDQCATEAKWVLCFWFGLATERENRACYQANVGVGFHSILTVDIFFEASIIII